MEARSARGTLGSTPMRFTSPRETIDLLAKNRQAALAMEPNDRIVHGSRPFETPERIRLVNFLGKPRSDR